MRWSAQIHAEFHVFCITQEHPKLISVFGYGPVTLSGAPFLSASPNVDDTMLESYNPEDKSSV